MALDQANGGVPGSQDQFADIFECWFLIWHRHLRSRSSFNTQAGCHVIFACSTFLRISEFAKPPPQTPTIAWSGRSRNRTYDTFSSVPQGYAKTVFGKSLRLANPFMFSLQRRLQHHHPRRLARATTHECPMAFHFSKDLVPLLSTIFSL